MLVELTDRQQLLLLHLITNELDYLDLQAFTKQQYGDTKYIKELETLKSLVSPVYMK